MADHISVKDLIRAGIDFSKVLENSADTLRYNTNKWFYQSSKTLVKFDGDTPSFLDGKTQYNHSEIITVLAGTQWNKKGE